jgi:hypothetical protein
MVSLYVEIPGRKDGQGQDQGVKPAPRGKDALDNMVGCRRADRERR